MMNSVSYDHPGVNRPLYSFAEADRIARVTPNTSRRWLKGYSFWYDGEHRSMPPVTWTPETKDAVSFVDLVTTLPAKAGSFSGHALADAPRFVLKAPSEPQYIQRGVNVPVGYVSARAYVYPLRERLLDLRKSTTRATRLRSVPRVYRDNSRTSFFRFVRKYG